MLKFQKTKYRRANKNHKRLDDWFSRFIRLRDTGADGLCRCATCQNRLPPEQMDCGHFVTRDNYNLRYCEQNVAAQCHECNRIHGGQQGRFVGEINRRYGKGTAETLLEIGQRKGRLKGWEAVIVGDDYKRRTMELLKEKGISKWW